MKISASALLSACLLASVPLSAMAQTTPVIIEAENGSLGENFVTGALDGATYVTTNLNATGTPTAGRTATYQVTFPGPGDYALYARMRVGPAGGDDDSWYFGNGFNTTTNWAGPYNTSTGGFTAPTATVLPGGEAGTQVFKWVRLTALPGRAGGIGPAAWTVPEGALTQTFAWGTREDGMFMDKLAFGRADACYTVADLDAGTAATGTCPPPPPPPPPPYTRVGEPLATGHDKFLGSAWSPNEASTNFTAYFNKVTPENAGKWGSVEPQQDQYNWAQLETAYRLAKDNGFPFHFHVLIWGNQQPNWIAGLPVEQQLAEIEEWFHEVSTRFPDIDILEVVNEPLHDPPCTAGAGGGGYCNALGGTGPVGSPEEWTWVLNSFRLAKKYFTNPNTKFMLNDYSIANDGNATTRYLALIDLLKAEDLIDVVGIQGHAFSTTEPAPMTNFRANLNRLATQSGLPIHVTELDIDGVEDEIQLRDYQKIFPIFWEHPAVEGVTLWGYRQGFHWRNNQGAWLIWGGASEGAERPAMQWLVSYLENALPEITPDQEFSVDENAASGTAVGTVAVTDADTGQTLSAWQIDSGSGVSLFEINADTGAISVVDGAALDFETTTSYTLDVSVFDGFRRSESTTVTINVENLNDNTPEIPGAQQFAIDGGSRNVLGAVAATDADDTNEPGFTDFQDWKIVGGTGARLFAIGADNGVLRASRPLSIDWRKSSYTLTVQTSDGANVSETQSLTITIPNRVKTCLYGVDITVPKKTTPVFLLLGATLGSCRAP